MSKKKYRKKIKNYKKYRKNPDRSIITKYEHNKYLIESQSEKIEKLIENIENKKIELENKKNDNLKSILIFSLLLILLTGFALFFINYPLIKINGSKEIILEYNTKYIDKGAKATKSFKDISQELITFNNVDTSKIGTYSVTYAYPYLGLEINKKRIVKVIDTTPPKITLTGQMQATICPNKKYQEEGYKAIDEYDGDITNNVIRIEEDEQIIYQAIDLSNNKTEVIRKISKIDEESPRISLTGAKIIYIKRGNRYIEPGYKATDNCDGDITNKVEINNQININTIGTYTITYKITDSSNNTTTETRTIKVIESGNQTHNNKSVIYLTFDDGPSNSITPKILDILKEEEVKATFFVVAGCNNFNKLIKREYDEGHTIALHSYSHKYDKIYIGIDEYFKDLNQIRDKVYNITGEYSNIIRFPGGSSNTVSKKYFNGIMSKLAIEVTNKGYHYFDWNVSSGDAGEVSSSSQVYQNVTNNLRHNRDNIILMHDFENNHYTLNALKDIIQYGKNNGYIFEKITMNTQEVHHQIRN